MNNKENKNTALDKDVQDKDKIASNTFPPINKIQQEPKEDYNLLIQNYEMVNLKSETKIFKHTDPSK